MGQQRALLFIPDISGFTSFVQQTAIQHSKHIIEELLELLIDANELDMTLAEIEGDALFFYKIDEIPDKAKVMAQVEKMFVHFHDYLNAYKYRRVCQCGACTSAENLNLKFVVHAGEIDFTEIKGHKKPFGHEVIVAHRLMKNDIPLDEYALLTKDYNDANDNASEELNPELIPQDGENEYDLGKVPFQYYVLTSLRKKEGPPDAFRYGGKVDNPWSESLEINCDIETLHDLIVNLDKRILWSKVDGFEYDPKQINQVGTKHICVIGNKKLNFEAVTDNFDGKLVYGEKTKDFPIYDYAISYFVFESISDKLSKLTVEFHPFTDSVFLKWITPLLKMIFWRKLSSGFVLIKEEAEKVFQRLPQ